MSKNNCLFEVSWEVCNKVGGINTVIVSKASFVQPLFTDYYLIGPYFKSSENEFIEEKSVPLEFEKSVSELRELGINVHFGTWLIKGNPKVILVEYLGYSANINDIKTKLWNHFRIDSLNSNWYDFDEAILWSWASGVVIEKLSSQYEKVFIQAHEWMSGGAIFYNKIAQNSKSRTIFTTHATMLGRASCSNGNNIYAELSGIDFDKKAYEIGIHTKHQTEKALAHFSDCFTTVSDLTAKEAERFYGKKCDVLLYNGFDNSFISNFDELKKSYQSSKDRNIDFVKGFFHEFYDLNMDDSFLIFTSGRNEFRNKGDDLMISALGKLNENLKENKSKKTVVSFFLIPIGEFEKDFEIANSINNYNSKIPRKIGKTFAPLSTHKVPFENPLIHTCFEKKLFNSRDDNVKIIIVPIYLNGNDGLFNRNYYDVSSGFDLGIFASYYEPWGYTPLESISYAVPCVTSDLAGFGRYFKTKFEKQESVKVLERENKTFDESSDELFNYMQEFLKHDKDEFLKIKESCKNIAFEFDWKVFINNYIKAYDLADKKINR